MRAPKTTLDTPSTLSGCALRQQCMSAQLRYRDNPNQNACYELAIILLKPGYQAEHLEKVADFIDQNDLRVIHQNTQRLTYSATLAIYNDIFRFSKNDIKFGVDWKEHKLRYMMSDDSWVVLVQGSNAQHLCETFKYELRDMYGKLSVPSQKLSAEEFEELAIRNIIHVVDASETELAVWLLTAEAAEAQ